MRGRLKGHSVSQETKLKISKNRKGKLIEKDNPFYNKKHTKESLKKISKASIRMHKNIEYKRKMKGRFAKKNHPRWKGGVKKAYKYSKDWETNKTIVKNRDNNKCQNKDCWHKTNVLNIHHIDYNTRNCNENNLITLCASCNARVNYKRKYWKIFFQYMIAQMEV